MLGFGKKKLKLEIGVLHEEALQMNGPGIDVDALGPYLGTYDGEKFLGGLDASEIRQLDYYTLRERSAQLFNENLYARGLIRRLVTNEISTGLSPESCPDEEILQLPEDSLVNWSENVESRFHLWGKDREVCDYKRAMTFGEIQATARREALIEGDVLVVLRQNPRTKSTNVELIRGSRVVTPLDYEPRGSNTITHGVEQDAAGRIVAYHVQSGELGTTRVATKGSRTGRLQAWLVYGTDKRLGEVRGTPMLGIIIQSLTEIDKYRDSAARKAVINSLLAMFIKKNEDKMGTRPISASATRHGSVQTQAENQPARRFNMQKSVPGMIFEELQHGEEPVAFGSTGTDVNFGIFEEAMLQSVAWANEVPPEIMRLAFSSNYSASQAAINEFKIYLNKIWVTFGADFCEPIYTDFLISEATAGRISAPGMLAAWRDPMQAAEFTTWTDADWYGSIKPSTDMLKLVRASKLALDEGWTTNARESRAITGTKYTKNIKRLTRENELKIKAMTPLAEFKKEYGFGVDQVEDETT